MYLLLQIDSVIPKRVVWFLLLVHYVRKREVETTCGGSGGIHKMEDEKSKEVTWQKRERSFWYLSSWHDVTFKWRASDSVEKNKRKRMVFVDCEGVFMVKVELMSACPPPVCLSLFLTGNSEKRKKKCLCDSGTYFYFTHKGKQIYMSSLAHTWGMCVGMYAFRKERRHI